MNEQLQQGHTREAFYRRDRRSVALARTFTRDTLADWEITDRTEEALSAARQARDLYREFGDEHFIAEVPNTHP